MQRDNNKTSDFSRREMLRIGGVGSALAGAALLSSAASSLHAQSPSSTYYNVRDFGARGDGSANDRQAIEAAIAAANPDSGSEFQRNQRGGVVYLPAGIYLVDRIKVTRNVTLLGEGTGTIIRQQDNVDAAVISPANEREYPIGISDLRIQGARNPGGSGRNARGIRLNTRSSYGGFTVPDGQHIINRVWIERTHAESILIDRDCRGTLVADCWLSKSRTSAGLVIDGSDSTISNTISRSHASDGFRVIAGNSRLQNCKAFFCRGNGFLVDSSRANLSVCEAQDNWFNGFHIKGNNGIYTGCLADSNQIAGFNIDPEGGYMGGVCMTGVLALGRPTAQAGKPWSGQPRGIWLNNGFINDSQFSGIARENSISQFQVDAALNEQTQIQQVVQG